MFHDKKDYTPNRIRLPKTTHSVRAAQAVLQYGVGAMVDFPSVTLMTAAPEKWDDQNVRRIFDERLQKILGVNYFGCPVKNDRGAGIAYVQFPRWYFCPECRKFAKWQDWCDEFVKTPTAKRIEEKGYSPRERFAKQPVCPFCKGRWSLVVSRVVVACRHGHIDDFPWREWCHSRGAMPDCGSKFLQLLTAGTSSEGLESIQVKCDCGAKESLRGIFSVDSEKFNPMKELGLVCMGGHPWKLSNEKCGAELKVLQRGSSSVYFPATFTSLVIPPYSSKLSGLITKCVAYGNLVTTIGAYDKPEIPKEMAELLKQKAIDDGANDIAHEIGGVNTDNVRAILQRMLSGGVADSELINDKDFRYRNEEYETLTGSVSIVSLDVGDDFRREETSISDYDLPGVRQVVLVPKIREVQALIGYSRISPVAGFTEAPEDVDGRSKLVRIKEMDTKWYPGYEVRGEGIFIEFDYDWFNKWAEENKSFVDERVKILQEHYRKSFAAKSFPQREITSRYLFLHTFSHLLMKRLSFECGYNIASLKERVYCGDNAGTYKMFGVFIYTATGDSEGTLGGLVRQGRPDRFRGIFIKAIESAVSCSNDPVCNLSKGQGRDALNLSSCYACTLVPETSCEDYNTLLDRGVIVGTLDNPDSGVFSKYLALRSWHADNQSPGAELGGEVNWPFEKDGYKFRKAEETDIVSVKLGDIVLLKGMGVASFIPGMSKSDIVGIEDA